VHLTPKAFDLLATLVAERPKVLAKAALHERLWPGTFVADANLSNLVAEVRDALGDRARTPEYIRTSHGFGYAFCGTVAAPAALEARPPALTCWLECNGRRIQLLPGENVIGRDPGLPITLDASTVSRRHARIVVSADGSQLEDFGSKNGTFRSGERLTAPVRLADGDVLHIGSLLVTFHARPIEAPTDTHVQSPDPDGTRPAL
jgi:FHA domain